MKNHHKLTSPEGQLLRNPYGFLVFPLVSHVFPMVNFPKPHPLGPRRPRQRLARHGGPLHRCQGPGAGGAAERCPGHPIGDQGRTGDAWGWCHPRERCWKKNIRMTI